MMFTARESERYKGKPNVVVGLVSSGLLDINTISITPITDYLLYEYEGQGGRFVGSPREVAKVKHGTKTAKAAVRFTEADHMIQHLQSCSHQCLKA